jgi:hypothetical protein
MREREDEENLCQESGNDITVREITRLTAYECSEEQDAGGSRSLGVRPHTSHAKTCQHVRMSE